MVRGHGARPHDRPAEQDATTSSSASASDITVAQCRNFSTPMADAREHLCRPAAAAVLASLTDRYAPSRAALLADAGLLGLAEVLRGKRVLFLGDSMSRQITEAMQCAAHRSLPGGVESVVRHIALPQRYLQDCSRLAALRHAALQVKGSERDPVLIRNLNYFLSYTAWSRRRRVRNLGRSAPDDRVGGSSILPRQLERVLTRAPLPVRQCASTRACAPRRSTSEGASGSPACLRQRST